jgi:Rrf2 family iron-sulfur cluster assembly transcriptional regulator
MILGTKARYAVMAMVELASRGGERPVSLAQLAQAQNIPLPYLEQIFSRLRRGGLVKSVRGPGGGYALTRAPQEVCIVDIVGAVDEPLKMTRCEGVHAGGCMSSRARCATHDLWDGLGNQIHSYLSSISLEDVCQRRVTAMVAEKRLAS